MAEYNENDYFPIITTVIRPNEEVPFDCFLLLRANQRVVLFIGRKEVFPESKLERLAKFRFDQLHILKQDKQHYFRYLENFVATDEGKEAFRKVQDDFAGSEAFEGLPDNLKKAIGEIKGTGMPEELEEKVPSDPEEEEQNTTGTGQSEDEGQDEQSFSSDNEEESTESVSGSPEEPEETVEVKGSEEDEDGNVTVEGVTDQIEEETKLVEGDGEVIQDDVEVVEDHGEVIQEEIVNVLQDNAKEIDEILNVKNKATKEEILIIKDVTDKIREDIESVRSADGEEDADKVDQATKRIQEQITRVSGMIENSEDSRFRVIQPKIEKMKREVEEISLVRGSGESIKKVKELAADLDNDNEEIIEVIDTDEKQLVEKKLSKIVNGIQKSLNSKINLESDEISETLFKLIEKIYKASLGFGKTLEARRELDPIIKKNFFVVSTSINKLYKIVTEEKTIMSEANDFAGAKDSDESNEEGAVGGVDPQVAKNLESVVTRQNKTIATLKMRLANAMKHFNEINEAWQKFQNETKNSMSPADKMKAQQFAVNLNELETHYLGMKTQTDTLMATSDDLSKEANVENASDIFEKQQESQEGTSQSVGSTGNASASTGNASASPGEPTISSQNPEIQKLETLEIPPPIGDDATIDEYRAENKVLRLQLENAKSLIEAGNAKLEQLTKLVNESGEYTESLEKETVERKNVSQKHIEKMEKVELENQKMREGTDDIDRILKRAKIDLANREEALQDKQDQLDASKKELQTWKARAIKLESSLPKQSGDVDEIRIPDEILNEINEKDQYIKKIQGKLDIKSTQYKELCKDNFKMKNQLQGVNQLKKTMSERHDKMQAEKENFRQSQDAMIRKVTIVQGLLDKARKTVAKITESNDQLRQERIEYMNKTNEAMKGYKDMINKANSLSNHVQAEIQRNQSLGDQFDTMKRKYQESMANTNELQREVKKSKIKIEQLKKAVNDAQNLAQSAGVHQQVKQLQTAVKSLERDNKKLKAESLEYKQLAKTFEHQAKTLQAQLKKFAA